MTIHPRYNLLSGNGLNDVVSFVSVFVIMW